MAIRDNNTNIGSLLQRIRLAKNMQQDTVCETIMSQSMLSRIESGVSTPTFHKLYELLKKMDIELSEFDYLLKQMHEVPYFFAEQAILKAIDTLDIPIIQVFLEKNTRKIPQYGPNAFAWIQYCFGVKIKNAPKADFHYTTSMLNQDEFFNKDIPPMIYALPYLNFNTAFYCSQRIKAQIHSHQTKELCPHLLVDVSLTLAIICYKSQDKHQALYYFNEALVIAKIYVNIERMLIILLILFKITDRKTFLVEAQNIKKIFSKDFFYNYWYNVIDTKYSIEVKK